MTETIQMYDPKRDYKNHKEEIDKSLNNVLTHGIFINGPEVKELENKLCKYTGSKYCVSMSNGTDALKVALLALGIKPNDEVITVAHTWISTAEVISIINAVPVFVDIEDDTYNIDVNKIENKITDKTKAIIAVSLYGQIPDFDEINKLAEKYSLPVIEDGAQSFGGTYKGRKSCNLTTIGTTSFFPSKPLGCFGDGGACFTNDEDLATKLRAIKSHGGIQRFKHKYIGLNARMDTLQAAVVLTKLSYFEKTIEDRNACAFYYNDKLKNVKGIKLPIVEEHNRSAWAQYSLTCDSKEKRDGIVQKLKENNVNAAIFYPAPLHTQECFAYLNYKLGDLPVTETVCDHIFNLPCYGEITRDEQDHIIKVIVEYFNHNTELK